MRRKIGLGFMLPLFIMVSPWQCNKRSAEFQRFAAEYEVLKNTYSQRLMKTDRGEEQASLLDQKSHDLDALLKKYEKTADSDAAELLRIEILIEISKFRDAYRESERLLAKKSNFKLAAQMAQVHALMGMGETARALQLFREIDPLLEKKGGGDRFMGWLYLALYSKDLKEREAYSRKFLETPGLPGHLSGYKADVYWNLAALAKEKADLAQASEMLKKAIALTKKANVKLAWESELEQLKWLGKPAQPIVADDWLNSSPLSREDLQGKVVVLVLWAPWCSACREDLGVLTELYRQYNNKDVVVLGYTKLYGTYQDEKMKTGVIPPGQEVALLNQFSKRHQLAFPIAVAYEGTYFESYDVTVIPTILFIDRQGDIRDIILGAASSQRIGQTIKKLLEDTNGKD